MKRFRAHMESEKQQTAWLQRPVHFAECKRERSSRDIHNGVKSRNSSQLSSRQIQGQHISFSKRDVRIQPLGLADHFGREIEAEYVCACISQITRDLTGTATDVAYLAAPAGLCREIT